MSTLMNRQKKCYILTKVIQCLSWACCCDKTPYSKVSWGEKGLFHFISCTFSSREVKTGIDEKAMGE